MLIGFLALVIDLARVYLARTGLQNAADAAALSGAMQLKGTAARICCGTDSAVAWARLTGGNNTFFGSGLFQTQVDVGPLDTSNNKISFSASPDGPWVSIASAQASPGDKYFIKVDTASGTIEPLFAAVINIFNMGTYGTAVAGPLVKDVAPMGVCAIDVIPNPSPINSPNDDYICGGPGGECGFLRGVAYNILDINPLMASSYPVWINPVDIPPGSCDPNHASANFMRPFVCEGKAAVGNIPGPVYSNTGGSSTLDSALNSRFDIGFGGSPNDCDPTTAPPDINIKQYAIGGAAGNGRPMDWMNPDPECQNVQTDDPTANPKKCFGTTGKPFGYVPGSTRSGPASFAEWGVLWSYAMEQNFSTGAAYKLCDWDNTCTPKTWTDPADPLYNGLYRGAADQSGSGYPAVGTPYQASLGNKYFQGPDPSRQGKADRRVLNVLIINCTAPGFPVPGPGAACAQLNAITVGKFFMPVQANLPNELYGEFAGLLPASLFKKQYILYQ